MDKSKTCMIDATPSDKVNNVMRKIPNSACYSKRDVYVAFEGRVLRKRNAVKACGISDESTLQVVSRIPWRREVQRKEEPSDEETRRGARVGERQGSSDSGVRQGQSEPAV